MIHSRGRWNDKSYPLVSYELEKERVNSNEVERLQSFEEHTTTNYAHAKATTHSSSRNKREEGEIQPVAAALAAAVTWKTRQACSGELVFSHAVGQAGFNRRETPDGIISIGETKIALPQNTPKTAVAGGGAQSLQALRFSAPP